MKDLMNLGKVLSKNEQKTINGGRPFASDDCHAPQDDCPNMCFLPYVYNYGQCCLPLGVSPIEA